MIYYSKQAVEQSIKKAVLGFSRNRCCYCGSNQFLGLDHTIPFRVCRSHAPKNLLACCRRCNQRKYSYDFSSLHQAIKYVQQSLRADKHFLCPLFTYEDLPAMPNSFSAQDQLAEILFTQVPQYELLLPEGFSFAEGCTEVERGFCVRGPKYEQVSKFERYP